MRLKTMMISLKSYLTIIEILNIKMDKDDYRYTNR